MNVEQQTTSVEVRSIIAAAWAGKTTVKPATAMLARRHARRAAAEAARVA